MPDIGSRSANAGLQTSLALTVRLGFASDYEGAVHIDGGLGIDMLDAAALFTTQHVEPKAVGLQTDRRDQAGAQGDPLGGSTSHSKTENCTCWPVTIPPPGLWRAAGRCDPVRVDRTRDGGKPFFHPSNIMMILNSSAAIGVIAGGMTLVILTAGITCRSDR